MRKCVTARCYDWGLRIFIDGFVDGLYVDVVTLLMRRRSKVVKEEVRRRLLLFTIRMIYEWTTFKTTK